MTIPISPVHVGTTGVVPNPMNQILENLLRGLQVGAELKDKKILRAQEQADRHANEQLGLALKQFLLSQEPQPTQLPPGSVPFGGASQMPMTVAPPASPYATALQGLPPAAVLPFVQATQGIRATKADEAAQTEAFRIFRSNLQLGNDLPAWQRVIAGVKDDRVGRHLLSNLQGMFQLAGGVAGVEGQNLQNVAARQAIADDTEIKGILAGLEDRPLNRHTIGAAIAAVAAVDPQRGTQVASSLAGLVPDYTAHLNDNGTVSWISKQPGGVVGAPLQPGKADADQRKAATYAVRVIEAHATMTSLEHKHPGIGQRVDDWIRAARAAGQIPAIGRSLETIITPQIIKRAAGSGIPKEALRLYVNSRLDLGNAILRNVSGATINMEELDREITPYVPMFRSDESVVPSIQNRRMQLGLLFVDQAGNAFNPNRLSPLARRYLLRSMAEPGAVAPDMNLTPPPNPVGPPPAAPIVPDALPRRPGAGVPRTLPGGTIPGVTIVPRP